MNIWMASYLTLAQPACAFASDLRKAGYQAAIVGINKNCLLFTPICLIWMIPQRLWFAQFFLFFEPQATIFSFRKKVIKFFDFFLLQDSGSFQWIFFQSIFFEFKAISDVFGPFYMEILWIGSRYLNTNSQTSNGPQGNSFWSIALFGSCIFLHCFWSQQGVASSVFCRPLFASLVLPFRF